MHHHKAEHHAHQLTKAEKEEKIGLELEQELEVAEQKLERIESKIGLNESAEVKLNGSKPISEIKKGDKIIIDGIEYEVDAHEILIDHGSTKEMAIECFNPETDKDYQLRYFSDQVERTMEFYELQEILYVKKIARKVEW